LLELNSLIKLYLQEKVFLVIALQVAETGPAPATRDVW